MSVKFYLVLLVAVVTGIRELHAAVSTCTVSCESSTLNEAVNLISGGVRDAKIRTGSDQLPNNESSCMSRKDLEDLKTVWTSNQKNCTRPPVSESTSSALGEDIKLIKEDLKDVKSLLVSNQPQNNVSCVYLQDLEELKSACVSRQQQNNGSSFAKQDLDALKAALSGSQQQCSSPSNSTIYQVLASSFLAHCIPLPIQQKVDYSNYFNRSWAEYKAGFNDSKGNYWIGNDLLSQLTQRGISKLRFDLQARNGSWYWAEYSSFIVLNETTNYMLHASGYSGNAGYDALSYSSGMMFTTYDRDNDLSPHRNNAVGPAGGFWYKNYAWCGVNAGFKSEFVWQSIRLMRARAWLTDWKCR